MSELTTRTDRAPSATTEFPVQRDLPAMAAPSDEDDYLAEIFDTEHLETSRATASVAWARTDRASPCYSHLLVDGSERLAVEKSFELGRAEIELLIAANRYDPRGKNDIIAFGLRGARLRGKESFEEVDRLPLEDARPDHLNFRCVIGYYFRSRGKFSAFTGSTVPWQGYMAAGTIKYNLLSPGCYIYKKGTHMPATRSRWVSPALRLSDADGAHSGAATVLRNKRDLVFELTDTWDYCAPADNIHCAYSSSKFSSLGCQTIKGGMNDGLWADFTATLKILPEGARVDYLLFTGAEASIAAGFISAGRTSSDKDVLRRLGRLRVGSTGDEVNRLQARLGESATGYFGPLTKKKLLDYQAANGLVPDGIFSPMHDTKLGWNLLAENAAPEPPPVAPSSPQMSATSQSNPPVASPPEPVPATPPPTRPLLDPEPISSLAASHPSAAVVAALDSLALQRSPSSKTASTEQQTPAFSNTRSPPQGTRTPRTSRARLAFLLTILGLILAIAVAAAIGFNFDMWRPGF